MYCCLINLLFYIYVPNVKERGESTLRISIAGLSSALKYYFQHIRFTEPDEIGIRE